MSEQWHVDTKTAVESYFADVNILRHDGLAVGVAVQNGDISEQQAMANARLMAAAPELLAAVKLLYQRIPSELVRNCGHIESLIAELGATP